MIISGLKKRSISDQTGNVEFNFSINSTATGYTRVGLSGTNVFGFTLKNGNIYDNSGYFVDSYEKGVAVNISGQVGNTSCDYYVDDNLIALGAPVTSGKYSWLFVDSKEPVDFNGFIKGQIPNYSTEVTGKYRYENFIVTGKIINNDSGRAFRILDASIDQPSSPYSIYDFTTGNITGTGYLRLTSDQIGLSDYIVPITLETNFGQVNLNFVVSGDYSVVPDLYLNVSPDSLAVLNNDAKNYTIQFANFPSGGSLGVSLAYAGGTTGNIYFFKEQVSSLINQNLTGDISGCGRLTTVKTGIVSGLDPKTSIWETGSASGILSSNTICATGDVFYDYSLPVYGFGKGLLQIDYLASGNSTGFYNGIVPLTGGYLDTVGYNYLGTGDFPGVASGVVPTGTGSLLVFPTGCVSVGRNLNLGSDYYSGIIVADKAYSGPLSLPYKTLAVGWATGDFISGFVDSNFSLNFEQGQYRFLKFFSGVVSGTMLSTGLFEPTGCIKDNTVSSGILIGTFHLDALLDCGVLTGMPYITVSGKPSQVYDAQKRIVQPNSVVLIKPSGGFGTTETSYHHNSGFYTRTLTSRMGHTSSGDGFFQNVIGDCLFVGQANDEASLPKMGDNIWKETINSTSGSGTFDSPNNILGKVSTDMYLKGTGDFDSITNPAVSGYDSTFDSGVMHFGVYGTGKKTVALRGLDVDGVGGRVLEFNLYKNGIYQWGGLQGTNDPGVFRDSNNPWAKWRTNVTAGTRIDDTVIVLDDLDSGYYSLYAFAVPEVKPDIFFKSTVFSGCESSDNMYFTVCVTGAIKKRVLVELEEYEEITAHSGVNYRVG